MKQGLRRRSSSGLGEDCDWSHQARAPGVQQEESKGLAPQGLGKEGAVIPFGANIGWSSFTSL